MPHSDFEGLHIPPTLRLTTGGEEEAEITRQTEDFFEEVRRAMGLSVRRCDAFFSHLTHELHQPLGRDSTLPTEDRLHLLEFAGIQQVASVLDRRDDSNLHVVTFSAHSLSALALDRVRRLHNSLIFE